MGTQQIFTNMTLILCLPKRYYALVTINVRIKKCNKKSYNSNESYNEPEADVEEPESCGQTIEQQSHSNGEPEFAIRFLNKEGHASVEEPDNHGHTIDQQSLL